MEAWLVYHYSSVLVATLAWSVGTEFRTMRHFWKWRMYSCRLRSLALRTVFWASISETNVDLVLWYIINRTSFSSNSNSNFAAKDKLAMADSRIRKLVGILKTVVSAVVGKYLWGNLIIYPAGVHHVFLVSWTRQLKVVYSHLINWVIIRSASPT